MILKRERDVRIDFEGIEFSELILEKEWFKNWLSKGSDGNWFWKERDIRTDFERYVRKDIFKERDIRTDIEREWCQNRF